MPRPPERQCGGVPVAMAKADWPRYHQVEGSGSVAASKRWRQVINTSRGRAVRPPFCCSLAACWPTCRIIAMDSTLLRHDDHCWLVIGSNGLIGSEMASALSRCGRRASAMHQTTVTYRSGDYVNENLNLLDRHGDQPLHIIFCAGKGGFSLSEKIAQLQHHHLQAFLQSVDRHYPSLRTMAIISSLGCACSGIASPYADLMRRNEEMVIGMFQQRSSILRLPSIYGYNNIKKIYGGLIGVMMRNLFTRKTTKIFAKLETRRNYLSAECVAGALCSGRQPFLWSGQGIINIQAPMSLSVFDVCSAIFRAIKRRPLVNLVTCSPVDSESHYPSAVAGASMIVNDELNLWIRKEWIRFVQGSPL